MPPAKLGLVYGHTGLRKFLDTIGLPRTKELFLTGRNFEAARAEQIGLVHEVVADERARGRRRSSWPPRSPPTRRSRCAATSSAIETLDRNPVLSDAQEAGLIALRESCFASEDFREGIRAFAEKRKPRLEGTVSARRAERSPPPTR